MHVQVYAQTESKQDNMYSDKFSHRKITKIQELYTLKSTVYLIKNKQWI